MLWTWVSASSRVVAWSDHHRTGSSSAWFGGRRKRPPTNPIGPPSDRFWGVCIDRGAEQSQPGRSGNDHHGACMHGKEDTSSEERKTLARPELGSGPPTMHGPHCSIPFQTLSIAIRGTACPLRGRGNEYLTHAPPVHRSVGLAGCSQRTHPTTQRPRSHPIALGYYSILIPSHPTPSHPQARSHGLDQGGHSAVTSHARQGRGARSGCRGGAGQYWRNGLRGGGPGAQHPSVQVSHPL